MTANPQVTNVGEMVQRAMCRLFGHAYEVTHTNRWQVATRRECRRCTHAQEHRWPPGSGWHDESEAREALTPTPTSREARRCE